MKAHRKKQKIIPQAEVEQPPQNKHPVISKKLFLFAAILIILFGFITYSGTLKGQFIWDDYNLVVKNPAVSDWSYITRIFNENLGYGIAQAHSSSFRPLQTLTYMIDHSIWGMEAHGFHLTNMLFHILAGLGCFCLLFLFIKDPLLAFITAIFFVIHPIQTEAVTYISGRAEPLSAVLIFLCLFCYLKYFRSEHIFYLILMSLFYFCALLSKEISMILVPIFLFGYHISFRIKPKWKPIVAFIGLTFLYILLRKMQIMGPINPRGSYVTVFAQRFPGSLVAFIEYLKLLHWPINLHMEYGFKIFPLTEPRVIIGGIFLILFIFSAVKSRKNNPVICFAILLFLGGLLPVSNIYPLNAYMAEHWLYLPAIGIFLLWARGIIFLYKQRATRGLSICVFIGLVLILSGLTIQQNKYWENQISFYKRTLKFSPESSRLHADLGVALLAENKHAEAIKHIKEAIELNPTYDSAYSNLAIIYSTLGQYGHEIEVLEKLVEIQPDTALYQYKLGAAYKANHQIGDSLNAFLEAVKLDPNIVNAYSNLGVIYVQLGQKEKAIQNYQKSIALEPRNIRIYNNLATTFMDLKRMRDAEDVLQKAIGLNRERVAPNDLATVYNNLGLVYKAAGNGEQAIAAFQKSISLNPKNKIAYGNLIELYKDLNRQQEANQLYQHYMNIKN